LHFPQVFQFAAEDHQMREPRPGPGLRLTMTVPALSSAGLSQYVSASSNVSASQQAFQSLQQSLAAGNLTAAKTAFDTYQQLNQNFTGTTDAASTSSTTASAGSSQLTTDLASLGSAINDGNLKSAQSAFATVQGDLQSSPSQAMANAESAVAQTVQWVDDLLSLSTSNTESSTPEDPVTSILDSVFGLNPSNNTDPATSILESAYGTGSSANQPAATPAALPSTGNAGSGASVNAYA
jgi:hypothetical protein